MRVLQLGPYPPPHGGVQINLVAIRRYLLKRQIPCPVISIVRSTPAGEDDVYHPRTVLQLFRLLYRLHYDIVHLHFGGKLSPRVLGLMAVCCLLPRTNSVMTFHSGGYPSSKQGRSARRWMLRSFVLRRFGRIIAVNREILDFLLRLGVSADRVRLIPPHSIGGDGTGKTELLPLPLEPFFRSHRPVIISVGLLEPEYDLGMQIDLIRTIRTRFPLVGLVIVGSGSLEFQLRAQINSKDYASDILLCGDVPHNATLEAIRKSNVMIRTTLYDGDALSVREALHLGTPVIASDNGMRPKGVRLIPPSNPVALCRALEQTLEDPRPSMAELSCPDEQNLEAVLSLYDELLRQR
jgi:glycosyltransferase involved in cell wall biosynthesis